MERAAELLVATRPTAVSLPNAVHIVMAGLGGEKGLEDARSGLVSRADGFIDSSRHAVEKIARFGARHIRDGDVVLTHCNSEVALGCIIEAHRSGKSIEVFATEVRPRNQGLITIRTLNDAGIKTNFIVDSAVRSFIHDIDLVIEEKLMTVADGFSQAVWTFGGSVPGPVIRVKQGDLIRIHLKNPATSKLPHSVDFHSSMVAWNDEMTSINPGEEKLYEYRALYAGVWMYHCGTAPALHHIANGMYGMMIVEPRGGLEKVDQEFTLVQSEWYLGPQGEPASLTKAAGAAPAPDFVLFNGVANQYKDNPIQIATGKRVRLFILDAGPSIDSSFHIVGTIFDRVIKEGVELAIDNPGRFGSQAVDLSPAQGAMVEFTMAEDGLYPIVTHAFNFVGRGALGLFKAGDGDPKN